MSDLRYPIGPLVIAAAGRWKTCRDGRARQNRSSTLRAGSTTCLAGFSTSSWPQAPPVRTSQRLPTNCELRHEDYRLQDQQPEPSWMQERARIR
jgi:hypothetical protein